MKQMIITILGYLLCFAAPLRVLSRNNDQLICSLIFIHFVTAIVKIFTRTIIRFFIFCLLFILNVG